MTLSSKQDGHRTLKCMMGGMSLSLPRKTSDLESEERGNVSVPGRPSVHFPSKHDALLEIEQRSLRDILRQLECVLRSPGSTRDRLALLFERVAKEAEEAGPMNRELLTELIHSAHTRGDEPEQVRLVIRATERLVGAGRAQGDVRTDQPIPTIAEVIRGGFYVLMISFGNIADHPIVERARSLSSLLADSIKPKVPVATTSETPRDD